MAPSKIRNCQSAGVLGKAIKDQLGQGEILLRDVLITSGQALALTDQRLIYLQLRSNFIRRSMQVEEYSLKNISGIEIDDLCPHYINGTRPSGFKLKLLDRCGEILAEWFGENDAIDTVIQLLLELQQQTYLAADRMLIELPEPQAASGLPGELGRKVNFMLADGDLIVHELQGKNERGLSILCDRLILVRNDREAATDWGGLSVLEIPLSRLDRILSWAEIVNPQIVMRMSLYFEQFGVPLPGGRAEHLSVLGLHWTEVLRAAMIVNALRHVRSGSYVHNLTGLS